MNEHSRNPDDVKKREKNQTLARQTRGRALNVLKGTQERSPKQMKIKFHRDLSFAPLAKIKIRGAQAAQRYKRAFYQ
ncbi:MAG: hypothetical protein Fur002_23460 [Anaerolineales bacterium]